MVISAYSRPISCRQKKTKCTKWDQGKEQRCAEYEWWEADVWCCSFIPGTAQAQTVGLTGLSEVWPNNSASAHDIWWGEVPLGLWHCCGAHTCWPAKPESFHQEGRERQPGWRVARTTNSYLHIMWRMWLSWWEWWCPHPVPPSVFQDQGNEKSQQCSGACQSPNK